MMKGYSSSEIKKFDKRPGLVGTFVHGDALSLTHWTFARDAVLAAHAHHNEQITYVVSGCIAFDREGQEPLVAKAGDFVVFAPNETHGGRALEDSVAIDAFSPVREDFKKEMGS